MLLEKIKADLVMAMKAREKERVSTLRLLISELNYRQIELQRELADAEVVAVVQREIKRRREAIENYRAGGRSEQAATEEKEVEILSEYVPKQMTEEEIKAELTKLELPKDFSIAMRMAAPVFKGRADGGVVAKIVKQMCEG